VQYKFHAYNKNTLRRLIELIEDGFMIADLYCLRLERVYL